MAYAHNPAGAWTSRHQMSINGKRHGFEAQDLEAVEQTGGIKPARARDIVEQVAGAVNRWPEFANTAGVDGETATAIGAAHRRLRPG